METLLLFFQTYFQGVDTAFNFLTSHPFDGIIGLESLWSLSPLALMTITGLIVYLGIAIVKWVIS